MFFKVTPESAITFVKYAVCLPLYWPADVGTSKTWMVIRNCWKVINFLNPLLMVTPAIAGVYYSLKHDIKSQFTSVVVSMDACFHIMGQCIISHILHDRQQAIIHEMKTFLRNMKQYEREIYQRYVEEHMSFYVFAATWIFLTASSGPFGALCSETLDLPLQGHYPFPIDHKPIKTLIFLDQTFWVYQCVCTLNSNMVAAILFLYVAGRFEILMIDLQNATTYDDFIKCFMQYQAIRTLAEDVVRVVESTIILTLIISSAAVVLAGLNLIGSSDKVEKVQAVLLAGSALLEVYMCAWPADTLMELSVNAGRSVFEAEWYGKGLRLQKNVMVMMLPRQPIIVSLKCVMSSLSLSYYASYVSNAFSLFTALRVIMHLDS